MFATHDSHVAHMHDGGSIAIKAIDFAFRMLQGDSQGNHGGVSHGSHGQEITFMSLVHSCTVLKQFTANHTSSANNTIFLSKRSGNSLYCLFAAHRKVVYLYILKFVIFESILLYDQRKNLLVLQCLDSFYYLLLCLFLFLRKDLIVYAHHIK